MLFGRIRNKRPEILFCFALIGLFLSIGVIFVGCQSSKQEPAGSIADCVSLIDKNDFQNAAQCYLNISKAAVSSAENVKETGAKAIFDKCGELRNQNEFETAADCYRSIVLLTPTNANVYFLLAYSYLETAKYASRVGQANPELLRENSAKSNENLVKAEDAVKKGLELKAEDAWGFSIYGEVLIRKDKKNDAVEKYRRAVALEPNSELYRINLGRAQEQISVSEAIENYRQALKINPDSKPALYYLGNLYTKEMRGCEAVKTFEKLKSLDANYDDANEKLKNLYDSFDIQKQCINK